MRRCECDTDRYDALRRPCPRCEAAIEDKQSPDTDDELE